MNCSAWASIGAALFSVIISYSGVLGGPRIATIGASGGVYAILIAFGMVLGENEIMLIPFPFMIKAKYFIAILIVLTLVFSLQDTGRLIIWRTWADFSSDSCT